MFGLHQSLSRKITSILPRCCDFLSVPAEEIGKQRFCLVASSFPAKCDALVFKSNGLNRRGRSEPGVTWPLFRMLYPLRTDFPAVISDHTLEGSFWMVPFRLVMLIADASVSATWRKTPSQAKDILYIISHFTSMLGNIFPLRKGIRCFIFWESYKTTQFFPCPVLLPVNANNCLRFPHQGYVKKCCPCGYWGTAQNQSRSLD